MFATSKGRWAGELASYGTEDGNVIEHSSRLPTHDEIEVRAYEIYLRHGGREGQSEADWLEAEHELMQELHGNDEGVLLSSGQSAL